MKISKTFLPAVAIAALFAGCQEENMGFTSQDVKNAKYEQEFKQVFGNADPDQDWSMAARTTANFNLTGIDGTAVVKVYTSNPVHNHNAKVLGSATIQNGAGSFEFYSIEGKNDVYVMVQQGEKITFAGNYTIADGNLLVGEFATRAFSADDACPTTQRTDENATAVYTYFNNVTSTKVTDGIVYPSDSYPVKGGSLRTLEEWKAYAKNGGTGLNGSETFNYTPFTDASLFKYSKIAGSDFSTLTTANLKEAATLNTEELIFWNNQAKSQQEWIDFVKEETTANNYQYYNDPYPFTTESIVKVQNYTASWDWSNPVLKDGADVCSAGSLITYNGSSKSLAGWKADAANNVSNILNDTYNGPWSNEVLKECINIVTCEKTAEGAYYDGLTDETTWVLKENILIHYANVQPTFQYLNDVEKAAAPGWNMATGNSFFGDGNFFAESVSVWDSRKLGKYYDTETMKKMEQGFSILTTANQVIELPFVFGVTAFTNQFGYIYYKEENEANIDPLALKHFVLIEDGRPASNLYRDTWETGTAVNGNGNGSAGDWFYNYKYTNAQGVERTITFNGTNADKDKDIICYCSKENHSGIYSDDEENRKHLPACYSPAEEYAIMASKSIIGTSYRPMFFGENGDAATGSYQWPAGYKIIFWINTLSESTTDGDNLVANHPASCFTQQGGHFNYSIPALNHRLYHEYQGTITDGKDKNTFGQVQTISWSIKNSNGTTTTFLAFGDNSGDKDLNDMVFMVTAPNDEEGTVVVAPVKWHLNYNKAWDQTDSDLFDNYSLNIGASYTNPKTSEGANSEPKRVGYIFKGWSTSPVASNGATEVSSTVPDENGANYFAVWEPVNPEPTAQSWIFACEDLGGSYDYDFNDIVWEVSQDVNTDAETGAITYSNVKITLLAAGGILPVQIYYGETAIGDELHTIFGGTAKDNGKYDQVNVNPDVALSAGVLVGEIAGTNEAAMDIDVLKTQLKLKVNGTIDASANYYVSAVRVGDKDDTAPQVLILPGDWCWPTEGTNIQEAYPRFSDWVKDTKNADWGSNKAEGKTMTR